MADAVRLVPSLELKVMVIPTILLMLLPIQPPVELREVSNPARTDRVLEDFSNPASASEWRPVLDTVMGGRSKGRHTVKGGSLLFSGETRLENNGGFSSLRSVRKEWSLDGARELQLRIRGDASRSYLMLIETSARRWGMTITYWREFQLEGDGWQTLRLPLDEFYPTLRGQRLKGPPLDLADVRSLGFMVYDKQAGKFRIEIDSIGASSSEREQARDHSVSNRTDIVALARNAGQFSTLLTAAKVAGLLDTLAEDGPFTILAPTDEAFAALAEGTLEELLSAGNRDRLKDLLLLHVIPETLRSDQLTARGRVASLQGEEVSFSIVKGQLRVNGSRITLTDLQASNGVIHVIDSVLMPPPAPKSRPSQTLIEAAIAKAVPYFNRGEVDACASIYELTISALLALEADEVSDEMRDQLSAALKKAAQEHDRRLAAWQLRRALDAAWSQIERTENKSQS